MKIVAIIQARMTSTRLPGKVLKKILGKTLLEYQLERVQRSQYIDEIVVATTVNKTDDPIVQLCSQLGYTIYRGSEEDVLSRYYEAAINAEADVVVRLTSDCPIIDFKVIDEVINYYKHNNFDYVTNTLKNAFPRGYDVEVFSKAALQEAHHSACAQRYREHVTISMYENPESFKIGLYGKESVQSKYRLTVDTKEDFKLISLIISELYNWNRYFDLKDLDELFKRKPELLLINSNVEQMRA